MKNELGSPVQIRGESDTKYLCSIWGMYFGQGCSALDVLSRPDMQPFGATESRRIISTLLPCTLQRTPVVGGSPTFPAVGSFSHSTAPGNSTKSRGSKKKGMVAQINEWKMKQFRCLSKLIP